MKQIVDYRCYLSFDNGKTWEDTSMWYHLLYDNPFEEVAEIKNYHELWCLVDKIFNAKRQETFFGKKTYVEVSTIERDMRRVYKENKFKPFLVKWTQQPINKAFDFEFLMKNLPATHFIEWAKDNGLEIKFGK